MYQIGNVYFIATVAVVGGALFGFDISSMSAIISTESYLCYFNQGPYYLEIHGMCSGPSSSVQGIIIAAMPGGSWLGALISGSISDLTGRKMVIQIGAIVWCIGSVIVCSAQNIGMLIVGRLINGISVGLCSAQIPVYISEISPPSKRGRLVGCQQWAITWGILIMFYICYGSSFIRSTASFRIPWGVQMLPATFLFTGMIFLPESPRWLAKKNRWDEAEKVLTLVHTAEDKNSLSVAQEMVEIRKVIESENLNADVSYLDLLKPDMIYRTHIGVFCQIWAQLTGMNVMMCLGSNVLLPSSIQFIINVLITMPAIIYVDRWGRRPTLLIGGLLMMSILFIISGLFATYGRVPFPAYAPTWGPVSWIYPPELFPLRIRSKAVAVSTSANWAFNFALAYFVPSAFQNIQWKVYLIFGFFCAIMVLHVFFVFPETSRKTLEEIETIFNDKHPGSIRFIGTPAWKTSVKRKTTLHKKEHGVNDDSGNPV